MRNRSVGSHRMNDYSSRSHTILTVNITSELQAEGSVFISKQGKINFVDLAGSEMTKKTNSEGKTLEEANNINKSLMVLGKNELLITIFISLYLWAWHGSACAVWCCNCYYHRDLFKKKIQHLIELRIEMK